MHEAETSSDFGLQLGTYLNTWLLKYSCLPQQLRPVQLWLTCEVSVSTSMVATILKQPGSLLTYAERRRPILSLHFSISKLDFKDGHVKFAAGCPYFSVASGSTRGGVPY